MPQIRFNEVKTNTPLGKIDYSFEIHQQKDVVRLNLIYLEDEHRGKGYGSMILEHFITKMKKKGMHAIIITMTAPDYDYYSSYEKRRTFFSRFGFIFDDDGDYAKLDLNKDKTFKKD